MFCPSGLRSLLSFLVEYVIQRVYAPYSEGTSAFRKLVASLSKDGVEVSSGLYIYHIQYGDDQAVTGHFAILR